MDWVELFLSLAVILAGAELFTNGVEWIGENFGLSEGVVGSVLAAIGTALPETTLPFVAILTGHEGGKDIGVGAILGAPFMLSTMAMCLLGTSVLVFSRRGRRSSDLSPARHVVSQDLGYFLAMYSLALIAGLWHFKLYKWTLAAVLVVGYGFYVRRHMRAPDEKELEVEAVGEVKPLYLRRLLRRRDAIASMPAVWESITQTALALAVIIGGARLFVAGIETLAKQFSIPSLPFALLIAPVATELPELFNSVLWIRRGKDTLAMGNVTGAMVFQSTFPVTIGLLFTPWRLSGDALAAALVALGASAVVFATMEARGRLNAKWLVAQGAFFVGYTAFVLARL